MSGELRKTVTVQSAGRLELDFPELTEGDTVEVSVKAGAIRVAPAPILQFGRYRGQIWMAPDFDAPLDDFREYM
jgi:hypothetical protein